MKFYRFLLLIAVTIIFSIGVIMIFSTTSADVVDHDLGKNTHQAFLRQLCYAIGGILIAIVAMRIGYHKLLQFSPYLLALFVLFLVLVLIPGIGREVNGSRRWLSVAGISFQPSEFIKYIVPIYFIHSILQHDPKQLTFRDFLKRVGVVAVPILLIMVEPNNGTAGVVGITLLVLFALMRISFRYWALPLLAFAIIGGAFAYNLSYVSARINVYLHPELDLKGKGHQPHQAKIAAGSGKLLGKGPGNSLQKLSYLPEAQNDYIAAIYGEEFGFLGIFTLISLYTLIAYLGFFIAGNARDRAGFYLAGSVAFLISFQAFLNLGVVSGLLPSTGLNLPFFSQGGTSLMANIFGLSLLIQVSICSDVNELVYSSNSFK